MLKKVNKHRISEVQPVSGSHQRNGKRKIKARRPRKSRAVARLASKGLVSSHKSTTGPQISLADQIELDLHMRMLRRLHPKAGW